MNPPRWLFPYQWFAGSCDTITGVLLVFAPERTLALMGIRSTPESSPIISFVGVFVLSVGLAYLYPTLRPLNAANLLRWETVWVITALSRSLVAGFLAWEILRGAMEPAWSTVAVTDGALAALQWIGLKRGWLRMQGQTPRFNP